jgi:hypothetical protein
LYKRASIVTTSATERASRSSLVQTRTLPSLQWPIAASSWMRLERLLFKDIIYAGHFKIADLSFKPGFLLEGRGPHVPNLRFTVI